MVDEAVVTITIQGASLPSWNAVMRMHKHAQHDVQQEWIARTLEALGDDQTRYSVPVAICVTSYQTGRRIDPDNLHVKGVIDALKTRLLPNDSPRWVDSVRLRSLRAKADSVTITLTPVREEMPAN